MKNFRDLKVWQKSHSLVKEIYKTTEALPRHEIYGLRSQVRRSALSIPSNIAEGCGRTGGCIAGERRRVEGCRLQDES
jgi:hypothetical protein